SDQTENANVKRLAELGIRTMVGHRPENLGAAEVIVVSTAVKAENPELKAARERHLPVVRRAEMLAELMRLKWSIAVAGTHGKTTTTSMCAAMLDAAGLDPTVINGGIINAYGTNARLGAGDWMVVESDESDGSFIKLPATIAIVTNIDPEHLDFWGDFDSLRRGFRTFTSNIPFYGFAVCCIDHPEVQALIGQVQDRRIVTYGFSPQAEVRAVNLKLSAAGGRFDAVITDRHGNARTIPELHLPLVGEHNIQNALAAVAVALEMGIDVGAIRRALAGIKGVKRRFTKTGEGAGLTVIDDYGHHPVEISAVLKAARSATQAGVVAVVQPHRYTRLKNLFQDFCACFNDADSVIVADVYPAGEAPIEGASREALVEGLRAHGHRKVVSLEDPSQLAARVMELAKPGDLVVCLGAGSISSWAYALPGELQAHSAGAARARGGTR
ncbi:MAG: UDP-N-acetylmuramate--L-alanine ligase, partial [Alphaproteobacteria bacterium]|nr:UDP-N-acetylmuramate--L-alanine ligase [Alphaproteobacteria bacterium]